MIRWINPEQKEKEQRKKSPVLEDSFTFVNDKLLDILALDKTSREYLLAASDSKTPFMITRSTEYELVQESCIVVIVTTKVKKVEKEEEKTRWRCFWCSH